MSEEAPGAPESASTGNGHQRLPVDGETTISRAKAARTGSEPPGARRKPKTVRERTAAARRRRTAQSAEVIRIGRPPAMERWSAEQRGLMIGALRSGNSYNTACSVADIHTLTFDRWRQRAAQYEGWPEEEVPESERVYVAFCRSAMKARDEAEMFLLDIIRTCARGRKGTMRRSKDDAELIEVERPMDPDWRAAGWILERTRPDRFGVKYTIKHEQKEEVVREMLARFDLAFSQAGISQEQRQAIGRALLELQTDQAKLAG